jgi:hypothetical protein
MKYDRKNLWKKWHRKNWPARKNGTGKMTGAEKMAPKSIV